MYTYDLSREIAEAPAKEQHSCHKKVRIVHHQLIASSGQQQQQQQPMYVSSKHSQDAIEGASSFVVPPRFELQPQQKRKP